MQYQLLKKLRLTILIVSTLVALNAVYPNSANAAGCGIGDVTSVNNAQQQLISGVPCIIGKVLDVMVLSSGAIFVLMVFYSAVKLSLSQGDPKGMQGVKLTLTWAVVGFAAVIGVRVIFNIVLGTLGINTTFDLGTQLKGLIDWFNTN